MTTKFTPIDKESPAAMRYQSTADTLRDRILALIPQHPEILDIKSCWDLFKVEGFTCGDLDVTMFQAGWALSAAKQAYQQRSDSAGT